MNMNLSTQQMRSLANLIESAGAMVQLYWDTDSGEKLGRSLEAVRLAFDDLLHSESDVSNYPPRLIIEAQCAVCGPLGDANADGLSTVRLAMRHSSALGHVIILNGTTDLPEDGESRSTVDATSVTSKPNWANRQKP